MYQTCAFWICIICLIYSQNINQLKFYYIMLTKTKQNKAKKRKEKKRKEQKRKEKKRKEKKRKEKKRKEKKREKKRKEKKRKEKKRKEKKRKEKNNNYYNNYNSNSNNNNNKASFRLKCYAHWIFVLPPISNRTIFSRFLFRDNNVLEQSWYICIPSSIKKKFFGKCIS